MLLAYLLFYLVVGHMLMDFALQGDAIASCKCRGSRHPAAASVPWYYWMSAHAFLHGGMVAGVLEVSGVDRPTALGFGMIETVIHWLIDYAKCAKWFGIHTDQILHIGCKILWVLLLANGVRFAFPSGW